MIGLVVAATSLSAQLKPNPKPISPSTEIKGPSLEKPVKPDFALSKCERHLKYQKIMWKVLLNANPSNSNPLELSKEVNGLRFVPANNATGSIVFDKTAGSIPIPLISILSTVQGYSPYPVPVTGTSVLYQNNNSNCILSFHWETGSYGIVKEVKEIYKIGVQNYIDVISSTGSSYTIKIFPGYLMDGCQIP